MKRSDIQELEGLSNWISDASARLSGSFPDNEYEVLEALDELETMCGLVLEKIEEIHSDEG
jgi:hypothetical protein